MELENESPKPKIQQMELEKTPSTNTTSQSFSFITTIFVFEFLGTALFAYGIMCSQGDDILISAYLFGAIFFTCKFTGGHVNPAVSLSFYMSGEIDYYMLKVYALAQFTGAFFGAFLGYTMLQTLLKQQSQEKESMDWILSDILGETLGTFIFILFIHIQVHEETKLTDNDVAGIGLICGGLFVGRKLTQHSGGCLNPAMGACLQLFMFLIDGDALRLANIWLFLIGPTMGSFLAHYFYTLIYLTLQNQK